MIRKVSIVLAIIIQTKNSSTLRVQLVFSLYIWTRTLGYKSGSCRTFIFPGGWQHTLCFVVTGQSVDTGFNQNQTELGILVLAVTLEMFTDGNSLLDQEIEIFGQLGSQSLLLQNTEHFVASNKSDLGNTVRISEDDTWKNYSIRLPRRSPSQSNMGQM